MDDELNLKSLRLLADPHKLREPKQKIPQYDSFKQSLESKFNYRIDIPLYSHIVKMIQDELIIDSIITDIINQAILSHSP